MRPPHKRRTLLQGGLSFALGCGLLPRIARGQAPSEPLEIDLPQLRYKGDWNPRPGAVAQWGTELRLRTRLEAVREPRVTTTDSPDLFLSPFVYVAGRGGLPGFDEEAQAILRRFVDLGGLIVFDDADGGSDPGFRRDLQKVLAKILPGSELAPVSAEHVLYRSFYIVDEPVGRTRAEDACLAVQEEGRLKVLYLPNDLGGALARDDDGLFQHRCIPGGADQREWAIRFAINILLYATCTDYKSDRAHVETLMRSRRWR